MARDSSAVLPFLFSSSPNQNDMAQNFQGCVSSAKSSWVGGGDTRGVTRSNTNTFSMPVRCRTLSRTRSYTYTNTIH